MKGDRFTWRVLDVINHKSDDEIAEEAERISSAMKERYGVALEFTGSTYEQDNATLWGHFIVRKK